MDYLTLAVLAALTLSACDSGSSGSDGSTSSSQQKTIRLGAASSPKYGAVFDAMKRDFERHGQPFEYTLYMDYHKLIDALLTGEVDIAWNTPMAHARAMILTDGKVLGPIARDVDIQYSAEIIVRKDSGINTIQDLVGKSFALGTVESAEMHALPKLYLKREGLDIDTQMTVLNLSGLVDDQMNSMSTATHVINAVRDGVVDAGAVGEKTTRAIKGDPNHPLKVIWTSPRYTHCIMTTLDDYDPELTATFKEVLLSETMDDPIGKEVLVNEGNDRIWMDSSNERDSVRGFEDLITAIEEQGLYLTEPEPAPGLARIRVGALASTAALKTFEAMKRYFLREGGTQFEFILYSTSTQLADALFSSRIDIAWNTPLDHARAIIESDGEALAPITSDSDMASHFHVIVRKDSGIDDLRDLVGRRLVLGRMESAELAILPKHFLPQAGLDLERLTVVSLDGRIDSEHKPLDGESAVSEAVAEGEGDAGVVGDALGAAIAADPDSPLEVIWTSPIFGYRTMTALPVYEQANLNRFNQLLLSMSAADPTGEAVLEGEIQANHWVPGTNDGYEELVGAVQQQKVPLRR